MSFEEWFERFQESVKNRSHVDGEEWARAAWSAGEAAALAEVLKVQMETRVAEGR